MNPAGESHPVPVPSLPPHGGPKSSRAAALAEEALRLQAAVAAGAYAYGRPSAAGALRAAPEDFRVVERLAVTPCGHGEHVWLHVRKRGANTEWIARQLARCAGVPAHDVGYAGLKDRFAVTDQWFSVGLAGRSEPDWTTLNGEEIELLAVARHDRKLRHGAIKGNRFDIVIRGITGAIGEIATRAQQVMEKGVPNYFGEQRFGHGSDNLARAASVLAGVMRVKSRHLRGLYYSAARAALFNLILSERIRAGVWAQALPGEALMLDGSRSLFVADEIDAELMQRLDAGDLHPSAPLWGRGEPAARGIAREAEDRVVAMFPAWCGALEAAGLEQARRPLRVRPREAVCTVDEAEACCRLSFTLPAGSYATAVIREILEGMPSPG